MITAIVFLLAVESQQAGPALSADFSTSIEKRLNEKHGQQYMLKRAQPGYGRVFQEWVPRERKAERVSTEAGGEVTIDYAEFSATSLLLEAWAHATSPSIGPGVSIDGPWDEGRVWWNYNGRGLSGITFRIGNTITDVGGLQTVVKSFAEDVAVSVADEAKSRARAKTGGNR